MPPFEKAHALLIGLALASAFDLFGLRSTAAQESSGGGSYVTISGGNI